MNHKRGKPKRQATACTCGGKFNKQMGVPHRHDHHDPEPRSMRKPARKKKPWRLVVRFATDLRWWGHGEPFSWGRYATERAARQAAANNWTDYHYRPESVEVVLDGECESCGAKAELRGAMQQAPDDLAWICKNCW